MRLPVRSESDAFWLVVACVVTLAVSLVVGYLAAPVLGVVAFGIALLVGLNRNLSAGEPKSLLRDAEQAGHHHGAHGQRLVLVVANATPTADQLVDELMRPGTAVPVLEVLAPVLPSRTHFVTTDIDRETAVARQRLDEILAFARARGLKAGGEVGDAIDPFARVADELRSHDVNEVLVTTHARDSASWVESAIIDGLRDQLRVPLLELVVDQQPATNER